MRMPEINLEDIKKRAERKNAPVRNFRASDFLTAEQKQAREELKRQAEIEDRKNKPDPVDAFVAEIIARFGYSVYLAWKADEIGDDKISKWILAERAREANDRIKLESLITGAIGAIWSKESADLVAKILNHEQDITKKGGL